MSGLKQRARRALLAFALAAAPFMAAANGDGDAPATLRLRVVVMRHGVRSPTSTPEELAAWASQPWQAWPVAPGTLTAHGAQGITALGRHYRQRLAHDGLWQGRCDALEQVVVIADSTPRNHASAAALLNGLAPDCQAQYLALPTDQPNNLFRDTSADKADKKSLPLDDDAWPPQSLTTLENLLLGCQGQACLARARAAGRTVLLDPQQPQDAQARSKTLKTAGSLAENLMLEYAEGFPSDQVAWGRGDEAAIGQLIVLHNLQFSLANKPLPQAARGSSNLLAHLLATWQQAAGIAPTHIAPLANANAKAIFVVGHDTNLATLAGVLDADWHDPRHPDDYPPGGALLFDLLDDRHGHWLVRISSLMPTLDALRGNHFNGADAFASRELPLPACHGATLCPLDTVAAWVNERLNQDVIDPGLPALTPWPAQTR